MKDNNKATFASKIIGSSMSGILEIALFHPVDTIAKRLMYNRSKINGVNLNETKNNLSKILFRDYHNNTFINKYKSLYPGVNFALGYKILQRTYKFGGQSILNDIISKKNNTKTEKVLTQSISGAIIGAGEVFLLPLDVLKIKMQTNPKTIANKRIVDIFRDEGMNLYRGTGMTILRNVPGSFALFGGNALTKETIFNLDDYSKATFFQNFISSTFGALSSITVSSPMDVIKTRIQAESVGHSGRQIITEIIKKEGIGAFYKGLGPKLLIVGPKLTFSFTIAQQLIQYIDSKIKK